MHPLLQVREVKKELVIVISTDKGLAGALNTNLFREVAKFDADKTDYIVVGREGAAVSLPHPPRNPGGFRIEGRARRFRRRR